MCGCCGSDEVEIVVDPHVTNFSPTAQPGCLSDAGSNWLLEWLGSMKSKQLRMKMDALSLIVDEFGLGNGRK